MLAWTLPGLPLVWLLWRAAHPATTSYADLFRSGFDLHRCDVYASLRWPKPTSPESEKAHGATLILYLSQGVRVKGLLYAGREERDE